MAKDRFSRFKKSNFDSDYWDIQGINHTSIGPRKKLNKIQRDWIIKVIQTKNINDWEKKFLRSILVTNKIPSVKQKNIIVKMLNK